MMKKPKKLIRNKVIFNLKASEWEFIEDQQELNVLYEIKIREEIEEIKASNYKDVMEFVDLIQVTFSFARRNGFTHEEIEAALLSKSIEKGIFGNIALNNLNPNNPSNKIYFE